jgi:hypothetical protein
MDEEKISKQIEQIKELAKKDKKVDISALIAQTLETSNKNYLPAKQKRIAFIVSTAFPLAGFVYAIKFWNTEAEDALEAAVACVILGCISIVIAWYVSQTLLGGAGTSGLQNLNPGDIYELTQ